MSTITVVKKNGYAAIAADSLTKWGPNKEPAEYIVNHSKILQVGDSYLAISGSTAAKVILKDYFLRREVGGLFGNVDAIFATWRELHQTLKEEYCLNPNEDPSDTFESSRIDTLIANTHGIFGVSAYRTVQEFSRFYSYGTGCDYAFGAMYSIYNDKNRTAEEIARIGIQAAAEFDDATGLPVISFSVVLAEVAGEKRSRSRNAQRKLPKKVT